MPEKPSKKTQIVEVAAKLFFEQGYHATGIKQIIEAADIAKGTFYCHFKSKEELGLEWLRIGRDSWVNSCLELFEKVGPNPVDKLMALLDHIRDSSKNCNYRGCAFLNTLAESPEIGCPMRQAIRNYKQQFHDFIASLVKDALPEKSGEELCQRAGAVILLLEGATVTSQVMCKCEPFGIAKRQIQQILAS